jgi:hypothetical protein
MNEKMMSKFIDKGGVRKLIEELFAYDEKHKQIAAEFAREAKLEYKKEFPEISLGGQEIYFTFEVPEATHEEIMKWVEGKEEGGAIILEGVAGSKIPKTLEKMRTKYSMYFFDSVLDIENDMTWAVAKHNSILTV